MWSGVRVDSQPAIVWYPTVQDSLRAACFTLQSPFRCAADLDLRILRHATMDESFEAPQFRGTPDLLEPLEAQSSPRAQGVSRSPHLEMGVGGRRVAEVARPDEGSQGLPGLQDISFLHAGLDVEDLDDTSGVLPALEEDGRVVAVVPEPSGFGGSHLPDEDDPRRGNLPSLRISSRGRCLCLWRGGGRGRGCCRMRIAPQRGSGWSPRRPRRRECSLPSVIPFLVRSHSAPRRSSIVRA